MMIMLMSTRLAGSVNLLKCLPVPELFNETLSQ